VPINHNIIGNESKSDSLTFFLSGGSVVMSISPFSFISSSTSYFDDETLPSGGSPYFKNVIM